MAAPATATLLDNAMLKELRAMDDDGTFLRELVELFAEDSRASIEQLDQALGNGDAASAKKIAHKLKGSSASIGARELSTLASDIEQSPDATEMKQNAERLAPLHASTLAALNALL